MNKIIEKLNNAQSVAILPHISEDGDAAGSCFAMAHILRKMGKKATVYANAEFEERLGFLGNDYVIYTPDTEVECDLCVCLDCGDIKRLGERAQLIERIGNSVNIDHHYSNTLYADENYVEGDSSSTGEVLYGIFEKMGVALDAEAARFLYTAICSDTGCFKFSSVSGKTMQIASKLIEYKIGHDAIARALFDTYTIEEIKLRARVMSTIESYCNNKVRVVYLSNKMLEEFGIDPQNTPSIVDIARGVKGTEIAIALIENEEEIRVNLRANEYADVSKIASQFGGGGHVRASGFRARGTNVEELKKKLIEACLLQL